MELVVSFLTLAALEIVLGIDNLIFISILAGRLPPEQREKARKIGIAGAFVTRLGLLFSIAWIVKLEDPLFHVMGNGFSGKDLVMLMGGLFLLYKATKELHHKLEGETERAGGTKKAVATMAAVVTQIMVLDLVFSLDSVITAVGMVKNIGIMIGANVVALAVMLAAGGSIHHFVEKHPTFKILALSFLLLVGFVLLIEGFSVHVPKGYIYFAMAFSVFVELVNMKAIRGKPVKLKETPPA